jgi:hypothetical protein
MAEQVCFHLRRGLPLDAVAERCGIHRDTLYEWRTTPSEFSDAIKDAEAAAEDRWFDVVERGESGWQSRAWLLERRYRDRYGRHAKVEHSGGVVLGGRVASDVYAEVAQLEDEDE